MFKLTRHVTAISIIAVFCLTSKSEARSAAVSSYQHLNGITILADTAAASGKADNEQILRKGSNDSDNENKNDNGNDNENGDGDESSPPGIWKDLSLIYRIYQQCASENLSVCLKVKLLTGLEKVLQTTKALRIIDGVQFVKSTGDNDTTEPPLLKSSLRRVLSEEDIEATLPRSSEAKEQHLNNLIFRKLAAFLRDHTLQVKFPDVRSPEHYYNSNSIESRKKKDKKGGGAYIMIPLLLGGTFVPIAYGALAMLAGKALIVSKLALVLASIIGLKKLLGGGGGKESHEVVVSSGGHSGWGRDMDLAYNGWKPAKESGKAV